MNLNLKYKHDLKQYLLICLNSMMISTDIYEDSPNMHRCYFSM